MSKRRKRIDPETPGPASDCTKCGHCGEGLTAPCLCPKCGESIATIAATQRKERFDKLPPLAQLAIIAVPIMIVMTSYTVMQLVDSLMISRIGPDEVYVAAQGNGGMVPYVFMALSLGLCTVINTFVSQNLGAGNKHNCAPYGWNGLWISLFMALLLIPVGLAMPWIFSLPQFQHSEKLQQLETSYGQILIAGAFFPMAARSIAQFFYGVHKPSVIMVAVLTGNTVNLLCNAVLIFGAAGAPEGFPGRELFQTVASTLGIEAMGVKGAAIGTVIGGSIEFGIPFLVFLSPSFNRIYKTRSAWKFSKKHTRDLVRLGWPGSLMFFNEMLCWALLLVWLSSKAGAMSVSDPALAEQASTVHTSAGWIALRFMQLSFMPGVGISIAITALVGRNMGKGRPDIAANRTWLGMKLTLLYMGTWALIFVIFPGDLIRLYTNGNQSPEQVEELVRVGTSIMWAAAVFQLFDAVAISLTGALRGAGDTVWPGVVTMIFSWVFIILGGLLMLYLFPTIGAIGPWIAASAYIVALGIALLYRFLGGKWKTIKLVESHSTSAPVPAEDARDQG